MSYDITEISGIFAGLLSFVAFPVYYISVINKKTIPNRATWFILTVVGFLIASSYYSVGAEETIWVAVSYIIGPLIIFILSIKYGEGGWNRFDKSCLFLSGLSIILWFISGSALMTLMINIFIDFLGVLPTIKKSYIRPYTESFAQWLITFFASILNIIAIREWIFSIYIYPLYMLIFNSLIMLPLLLFFIRNRSKG